MCHALDQAVDRLLSRICLAKDRIVRSLAYLAGIGDDVRVQFVHAVTRLANLTLSKRTKEITELRSSAS